MTDGLQHVVYTPYQYPHRDNKHDIQIHVKNLSYLNNNFLDLKNWQFHYQQKLCWNIPSQSKLELHYIPVSHYPIIKFSVLSKFPNWYLAFTDFSWTIIFCWNFYLEKLTLNRSRFLNEDKVYSKVLYGEFFNKWISISK